MVILRAWTMTVQAAVLNTLRRTREKLGSMPATSGDRALSHRPVDDTDHVSKKTREKRTGHMNIRILAVTGYSRRGCATRGGTAPR